MFPGAVEEIVIAEVERVPGVRGIAAVQVVHEVCESTKSVDVEIPSKAGSLTGLESAQAGRSHLLLLLLCASSRLQSKRPAR